MHLPDTILVRTSIDSDTAAAVEQLLASIRDRLASEGFDELMERLLSHEGGGQALSHGSFINLFPSDQLGPCAPVLVVFARGSAGRASFNKAMRHVRQHLTRCPITRAVVFVTDTLTRFGAEHAADWAAHASRGVTFRAFLAGQGLRGATEVDLDLVPRKPRARA
jgi:hypothetical protein